MERKETEIRTPNRQLLLGVARETEGGLVLEVYRHGKTDAVEVQALIRQLQAL